MNNIAYIYGLFDPVTKEIRYIGKTSQLLEDRLNGHIWAVKQPKCRRNHKSNWIKKLLEQGLKPDIQILEIVVGDWKKVEAKWIAYGRQQGWDLTNGTAGGDDTFEMTLRASQLNTKPFPEEAIPMLGKMIDREIAEVFSVPLSIVRARRIALGIPARGISVELPSEYIPLLGSKPDTDLSKELGVPQWLISRYRRKLGIKPHPPIGKKKELKAEDRLPNECIALLGKLTDTELARRFNTSSSSVRRKRMSLGIKEAWSKNISQECIDLLGIVPDLQLSKRYNIPMRRLAVERKKRNIQASLGRPKRNVLLAPTEA